MIKDTFDFVEKLNKVHPTSSDVLVSFDVNSLFTNIPIDFTINLLLNLVFDGKPKDGKFYGMNKQQLKKMLEWTTKKTVLQFNGSYYEQTNGVAMGTPIAPLLADICMNWVINKTSNSHVQPKVFFRYVDDCLAIFSNHEEIKQFYQEINNIHTNIKFTYELEENGKIPFLDVFIEKRNQSFISSVNRKKTNTGLNTNWKSFIPFKYKINIIKCLIDRSYKICNSYQKIHEEFQKVTTLLLNNGYPRGIIDRHIKTYLNRKHKPLNENASEIRKSKFAIFCLLFIGEASQQIEKEIKHFLENKIKANFCLRMNHSVSTIGNLLRNKDKQALLHLTGTVYKLQCSCKKTYIGQSKRNLKTRLEEHDPITFGKSDVTDHLRENPDHTIDFHNPHILAQETNWRKLRIKETLYIQKLQPQLNSDEASHPLYLFNV